MHSMKIRMRCSRDITGRPTPASEGLRRIVEERMLKHSGLVGGDYMKSLWLLASGEERQAVAIFEGIKAICPEFNPSEYNAYFFNTRGPKPEALYDSHWNGARFLRAYPHFSFEAAESLFYQATASG